MASGGVGDVLTGIIASLAGQGFNNFEAAKYGVFLHGLAGDIAAKKKGQASLRAQDVLDSIPKATRS
jgi:NAD(P)H-hydrate epimerase